MALAITATMTTGVACPATADPKIANFAVKPLVSGMPASASKKNAKILANRVLSSIPLHTQGKRLGKFLALTI